MESRQIENLRRWVTSQPELKLLLEIGNELKVEVYLVGGLIRDGLKGLETRDVDLVQNRDSLKAAGIFADRSGGTLVLLREEGGMARVILGDRTFDFAQYRGPDLKGDLQGRDFTVNAIAFHLPQAFNDRPWEPFDPLGGINDLDAGRLRMVSVRSFEQDPLRLLRAFRLSAQLDLSLTPDTREAIRNYSSLLIRPAPERIRYEWLLFLSQSDGFPHLQEMDKTGLLAVLFPELERLKEVQQDRFHHLDAFQHSLETFHNLENLLTRITPLPLDLENEIDSCLSHRNRISWLKWAALLHDLGKADTASEKAGHRTFYGHVEKSWERFVAIAERFRLSNQGKQFIGRMISRHMRPLYLMQEETQRTLTRRALIRLVRETGEDVSALFLLALADSLAMEGKEKPPEQERQLISLWGKALSLRDELIRPFEENPPLLTGKDLIALGLSPGPLFKTLLSELQEKQLEGRIACREQALVWIKGRIGAR
jgi:tRNA nucleotidyltransferase/poly(A) polymerase